MRYEVDRDGKVMIIGHCPDMDVFCNNFDAALADIRYRIKKRRRDDEADDGVTYCSDAFDDLREGDVVRITTETEIIGFLWRGILRHELLSRRPIEFTD